MEDVNNEYIGKCLHHPDNDPLCPIFKLGDIVKLSGFSFETIAREVSSQDKTFVSGQFTREQADL